MSRWLGWAGLVAIALLGLLSGGVSSGLIMVGLYVLVVGVIALARGHVGWARLGSRVAGGLATGAGFVVLLVGAVVAPATAPPAPHTLAAATEITTTAHAPIVDPAPASVTPTARASLTMTTRAAVVVKPKPPAPKKTSAPKPKPKPKPKPPSCYPLTNGGNCYEPGEFCRASDHEASGIAGNGEKIVCLDNHGWRWEPA